MIEGWGYVSLYRRLHWGWVYTPPMHGQGHDMKCMHTAGASNYYMQMALQCVRVDVEVGPSFQQGDDRPGHLAFHTSGCLLTMNAYYPGVCNSGCSSTCLRGCQAAKYPLLKRLASTWRVSLAALLTHPSTHRRCWRSRIIGRGHESLLNNV